MKDANSKENSNFRYIRFLFFELWRKNNGGGNSLNAIERELVPTRVLNPNANEVSYKPKQRSYRKTKPNFFKFLFFFRGDFGRGDFGRGDYVAGILSGNQPT